MKEQQEKSMEEHFLLSFIEDTERRYFRAIEDIGANECAMFIWNRVRDQAGLLPLRLSDLRAWDGVKYTMPEQSRLLENRNPQ